MNYSGRGLKDREEVVQPTSSDASFKTVVQPVSPGLSLSVLARKSCRCYVCIAEKFGDLTQPRTSLNGRLSCRTRRILVQVCEG